MFTDEDLKSFKERLTDKDHDDLEDYWPFKHDYLEALIARLEAGEAYINEPNAECDCGDRVKSTRTQNELYLAWRKEAGKS